MSWKEYPWQNFKSIVLVALGIFTLLLIYFVIGFYCLRSERCNLNRFCIGHRWCAEFKYRCGWVRGIPIWKIQRFCRWPDHSYQRRLKWPILSIFNYKKLLDSYFFRFIMYAQSSGPVTPSLIKFKVILISKY